LYNNNNKNKNKNKNYIVTRESKKVIVADIILYIVTAYHMLVSNYFLSSKKRDTKEKRYKRSHDSFVYDYTF